MQRIPFAEIVFCNTHKQHLSHVTVVDPDSSDFTRTSFTDLSVTRQSNSIPTTFLLSTPKEVFTSKIIYHVTYNDERVLLLINDIFSERRWMAKDDN